MYNSQLQKEGFDILSKVGISVRHSCLHRTLTKAQSTVESSMIALRKSVENNKNLEQFVLNEDRNLIQVMDHDYVHVSNNVTASTNDQHDHGYCQKPVTPNVEFSPGYRFNFDNLDFLIHVRDMTEEHQNLSKHYVQLLAIKDRVNCEHLPNDHPIGDLGNIDNNQFLPSATDNDSLRNDFLHVISLILIENVKAFEVFRNVYPQYFTHNMLCCGMIVKEASFDNIYAWKFKN